jgi:putative flippase GtrA
MNDILKYVGYGVLAVVIYEIIKYLLKKRVTNDKILIPVSMVLAIVVTVIIECVEVWCR